jgi:nucleoside-diphosphate kinase
MTEKTLIILKPDAIQRGLIGEVIKRFETKGLKLAASKFLIISKDLAERHYSVHKGKDFYDSLIEYITSGPVMAMVWQGDNVINISRKLMGQTFGTDADPGTIRGDLSMGRFNIVHGSDSPESAKYEISLYFSDDEIVDYDLSTQNWIG